MIFFSNPLRLSEQGGGAYAKTSRLSHPGKFRTLPRWRWEIVSCRHVETGNGEGNMVLQRLFLPLLMLGPFQASAADCGHQPGSAEAWTPPAKGIVTNAADAMNIARMAWIAVNPAAKAITSDEWRKSWRASLDGDVWEVDQSRRPDTIGGDVIISISRCDGRVLDILLTQ